MNTPLKRWVPMGDRPERRRRLDPDDDPLNLNDYQQVNGAYRTGDFNRFYETWKAMPINKQALDAGDITEDELRKSAEQIWCSWQEVDADIAAGRPIKPMPPMKTVQCEICQDRGTILIGKHGFAYCPNPNCASAQREQAEWVASWRKKLAHVEVPADYEKFSFDSWLNLSGEEQDGKWLAYAAARMYAESDDLLIGLHEIYRRVNLEPQGEDKDKRSLVFYGEPGGGKTSLSVSIAKAIEARNLPALVVRTWWVLQEIKEQARRSDDDVTAGDLVRLFRSIPFLVLDEFGREKPTDADLKYAFELIDYRYSNNLPTVFTTNLNEDQIRIAWGKPIAQRIAHMAHFIHVGGVSLRDGADPVTEISYQ